MTGKSKFDYEIESFVSTFQKQKNKRIVLYGTGRMTATLVNRIKGFNIVGLCDRDSSLIGEKLYDLPVLGKNEVEQEADLVIINTSATYWRTIYQRIKEWNVPVYFLNGERAKECLDVKNDDSYWNKSYAELRNLIEQHDIVSFDIFDTLVMRKVMFPIDLFRLTEQQLDKVMGTKTKFMAIRKKASSMLECPTLDEIYMKMSELTGMSKGEMERWKKEEIEIEKKLLSARKDMVCLCKEVMVDKPVYFISDMYYSSEILREILGEIGLWIDQKQIIVSCEQKSTKEDGKLWRYYKNIIGDRKAIHIGDDEKADIQNAEKFGITTYRTLNAYEMLQKSSIKEVVPTIESLYSSIAMGLISTRIFNSPFALNSTQGKLLFTDEEEAGYCIMGSLLYVFMEWLSCRAEKEAIKKLLFFAREGYLLIPIYNHFKEMMKERKLPEAVYLEISRRVVWNASISDEEDIYEIAQFPYIGNLQQFMKDRFGIIVDEEETSWISVSEKQNDKQSLKNLMHQYEKKIFLRSEKERKNYQMYFSSLGIREKYAVVDSQFYGSTQYYLGKVLGKMLKGYYFCACTSSDNQYLKGNEMDGCFQGNAELQEKDTNVHKQAQFLEAFFTAPEGMLEYIESDGSKKYTEKMSNQKYFDVRLEMVEGIKKFICQMTLVQQGMELKEKDYMWADKLFGYFMNQGFIPSDKMKCGFYFDNYVSNKREMPIWE